MKREIRAWLTDHFPQTIVMWTDLHRPRSAERELELLPSIVPPGLPAIDVGANVGLYSRKLAKLASHVFAFEPAPEMATFLRRVVPHNVTVSEVALSNRAGEAVLNVPTTDRGLAFGLASLQAIEGPTQTRLVRLDTLDAVGPEQVGFLKIDVEGHELEVLKGGRRLLEHNRPVCLVETEERHRQGAPAEVFAFFAALGYQAKFLRDGKLSGISEFDLERDQNPANLLEGGGRGPNGYINNFLFFPS